MLCLTGPDATSIFFLLIEFLKYFIPNLPNLAITLAVLSGNIALAR
jgi:hypothetical protein